MAKCKALAGSAIKGLNVLLKQLSSSDSIQLTLLTVSCLLCIGRILPGAGADEESDTEPRLLARTV